MAIIRAISQIGNQVLRRSASPVENIKSKFTRDLIDDLVATVEDAQGVGIAAPQIYEPVRIFIIASQPNPRHSDAPAMKPTAVINPIIISHSNETEKDWEGCLSVPGIRGYVSRFKEVKVEFLMRSGKEVKTTYRGFAARIFQHEYDHLEGIIFLDRLESTRDMISEKEYLKIISQGKIKK